MGGGGIFLILFFTTLSMIGTSETSAEHATNFQIKISEVSGSAVTNKKPLIQTMYC
jgi:hypothetical protein